MIIRKEEYDSEFDYIGHKKQRIYSSLLIKKTWRDYSSKQYIKKTPEDIISYENRNLKRVSIVAINIVTGEEKVYKMMKDSKKDFLIKKVYHCINAPFGKYKHRGHYFKRQS
jgi:hypothetical protein